MKTNGCCLFFLAVVPLAAATADWGDVTGTFVVAGKTPVPAKREVNRGVIGRLELIDNSLLVSPKGRLTNVVVHLHLRRGVILPSVRPAHEAKKPTLDIKGCRFEPHVLCMTIEDELTIRNADPVGHSAKIDFYSNKPQNPFLPAGGTLSLKDKSSRSEPLPTPVTSGIYSWMKAWVFVQEHPYHAVSDADGMFTIKNVPVGEWRFRLWHERSGYVRGVDIGDTKTHARRGTFVLTVKPGENDLGVIKVPSSLLSSSLVSDF